MRATMSSGNSTYSRVTPSTNSPGWMTNTSASGISSVRLVGGSRRSIAAVRWLWKTRKLSPRRRSTDAGCTSAGSHGSITIRPSSTRRRIVPSDRTDVIMSRRLLAGLAGPGLHGPDARRRERQRVAVRAPARVARELRVRVRIRLGLAARAAVATVVRRVGVLLDRPPDDVEQHQDGDLQEDEQVEHRPPH